MALSVADSFLTLLSIRTVESTEDFILHAQSKAKDVASNKNDVSAVLRYASECVYEFVELNWSCPVHSASKEVSQSFGIDGCNIPPFSKSPQLLLVAKAIFNSFPDVVREMPDMILSRVRAVGLYQWLLDEPSHTMRDELDFLVTSAQSNETFLAYLKNTSSEMAFYLECFHYLRLCNSQKLANDCLEKATAISGLEISFASALGKRTRFQTENIAQLYVKVDAKTDERNGPVEEAKISFEAVDPSLLPSNVTIDDDVYLNEVKFENSDSQFSGNLTAANQALVLAKCLHYAESLPKEDSFLKEEVAAFLQLVLKNPTDWGIQFHALFLRSIWEQIGTSSRKLDRALRQLDHLSSDEAYKFFQQLNKNNPEKPSMDGETYDKLEHRFKVFRYFFAALPPAPWTAQRTLGDLLNRAGATASALEIYEKLHCWQEVIQAATKIGRREKAESLIHSQLQQKVTPELLVYLGDCTSEQTHYEEAWRLSKGRCSKAQRNLGFLLAHNKEFSAAASCFEKCLAINPLQNSVWFAYGCIGLALSNYEMASSGFYKCTQLDTDNGEAWSNLATAYIKMGQKPRAVVILQEAIRCQYDNWRLWENYLLVTLDCGVFDETIRAIHRLIDIRGKYGDADVIQILSRAVCDNIMDASNQPSNKHRHALLELLGRMLSTSSPGAKISRFHANVVLTSSELKPEDIHRAISSLQRAVRTNLQVPSSSWHENDFEVVRDILDDSLFLHSTYLRYASLPDATEVDSLKTSLKYLFPSVLSRVQSAVRDVEVNEDNEKLLSSISKMTDELQSALKS